MSWHIRKILHCTKQVAISDHPSVKNSHSAGAIGVMAVKKTVDGVWLHFAHNTDSFVSYDASCICMKANGILYRRWHPCTQMRRSLFW